MNFETATWSCSFCGKRGSDDTRFAGGLGALMCDECLVSYSAAMAAPENAHVKIIGWSAEAMPDADMLARLPLIAESARQVDRYLRLWVGRIRERHISYAEIGKALGVSRQAAWERFSRSVDPTKGANGTTNGTTNGAKTPV